MQQDTSLSPSDHAILPRQGVPSIAPAPALRPAEPYARDELLYELFDGTRAAHPDATALRLIGADEDYDRKTPWTYTDLATRSLALAHRLRAMGIGRGDRIVLCLPRGLDQYMAILGVLRAGAAYVPVDWGYPQDRIDFIVEDSEAAHTITVASRVAAPSTTRDTICRCS